MDNLFWLVISSVQVCHAKIVAWWFSHAQPLVKLLVCVRQRPLDLLPISVFVYGTFASLCRPSNSSFFSAQPYAELVCVEERLEWWPTVILNANIPRIIHDNYQRLLLGLDESKERLSIAYHRHLFCRRMKSRSIIHIATIHGCWNFLRYI